MNTKSSSISNSFKTIGTIIAVPIAVFSLVKLISENFAITLSVAIIIAIIISVLVANYWKAKVVEVIVAWLILIVAILAFFSITSSITVEGTARYSSGEPVDNEKILLIDAYGISHETRTNEIGYYQFLKVPKGEYKVSLRENEVEGASREFWVRTSPINFVIPMPTPTLTPTPNWTSTPTTTPTSTSTLSPTAIPVAGDFEVDTEKWGDFPAGETLSAGVGVSRYCGTLKTISKNNFCSLEYKPINADKRDAYVARRGSEYDANSLISVWVFSPVETCTNKGCSTVRIIVWDQKWKSYESEIVELNRAGDWIEIKIDLRGKNYPAPFQAIGLHFYLVTDYKGPFYLDALTITTP